MMELLERFVVAIESIANSFSVVKRAEECCPCDTVVGETSDTPEPAVKETEAESAGLDYPRNGDRDAWLELCAKRGIDVPKGTKTATLLKKVKAWDAAHMREAEVNAKTVVEKEVDPFAPSGFGSTAEVKVPPVTMKMVLAALQPIQKGKGNAAVIDILSRVGGVDKLIDLPEGKYAAVYEEAKNG